MLASLVVVLAFVTLKTDNGDDLSWRITQVPFAKNSAGTPDTSGELAAVDSGFASWNQACGVNYGVQSNTSAVGDPSNTDGRNIVSWVNSGWSYGAGTIAVTFTFYNPNDGEIGEADMLMNGDDYFWTTSTSNADTDVEAITAHEAGHFLGLDHTGTSEATMYATVEPGETKKRSLHSDDIAGGQFLYGDGTGGLDPAGDDEGGSGCGCVLDGASGSGPRGGVIAGVLAVFALLFGALARRRMALVPLPRAARRTRARTLASVAAIGVAGMLSASTASATTMLDLSLEDLAAEADAVVLGTVEAKSVVHDGRVIETINVLRVSQVLAGELASDVIDVRTLGGELPEGVAGPGGHRGMKVAGSPRLEIGQEVVVFAGRHPSAIANTFRIPAMQQGKMLVSRDGLTNEVRLYRDLSGLSRLVRTEDGLRPAGLDLLDGMTLHDLKLQLDATQK